MVQGLFLVLWFIFKNMIDTICDLRFSELQRVLEYYGYEMKSPKGGSSHYTFRKSGCMPITLPKHEPIKKVYVQMVREIVESEVSDDENN